MLEPGGIFDRESVRRVVSDKIRCELAGGAAPCGVVTLPPVPWPDDLPIGPDGLGLDSLDVLRVAGSINEMFHVHSSGLEDLLLARRTVGGWLDIILRAWAIDSSALTFATSGSGGVPKPCTHRTQDLLDEAQEHARRLRPGRVLSAVPSHHIYGFIFTVLLPAVAGVAVVDVRPGLAQDRVMAPGDVLVSFPDHFRYVERSAAILPAITGVSSAAPMPPELARRLRAKGLARLVEIYGCSENGGMGWRDTVDGPYQLLDVWRGVPAAAAADSVTLERADGRRAVAPDRLEMVGERRFRLAGRVDGAVQVGGVNVFPSRVAEIFEAHPDIARARVRLSGRGARLKALLVPKSQPADIGALHQSVQAWAQARLSVAERPCSLQFAMELPRGPLGKDVDWADDDPAAGVTCDGDARAFAAT